MKKKVTPEKTANEWLELIQRAVLKKTDEIPPGYKTVDTISRDIKKSESQTRRILRRALREGLVDQQRFRIQVGEKTYHVPHFKIT